MSTPADDPGPFTVGPFPLVLMRAGTLLLPAGATRERYRLEHYGELRACTPPRQIRYAVGALTTAWALRQAVTQEQDMTAALPDPSKPLLCRLNLHHRWRVEHSPSGDAYRRCSRCGKDDPGSFSERPSDIIGPLGSGGGF